MKKERQRTAQRRHNRKNRNQFKTGSEPVQEVEAVASNDDFTPDYEELPKGLVVAQGQYAARFTYPDVNKSKPQVQQTVTPAEETPSAGVQTNG